MTMKLKNGNGDFIRIHRAQNHQLIIKGKEKEVNSYHTNYLEKTSISKEFEIIHKHLIDRTNMNFYSQKTTASIKKMLGQEHEDINKKINKTLKQTKDIFLKLQTLEGKLLLLARKDAEKLLREYRLVAIKIETISITSQKATETLNPIVNELYHKRSRFYESISKLYNNPQ